MGYCGLLELLSSDKWTREEHILVFNLYCRIPFGRQDSRAPEMIELARLLGRSANSVALKLNKFSRLDPGTEGPRHQRHASWRERRNRSPASFRG